MAGMTTMAIMGGAASLLKGGVEIADGINQGNAARAKGDYDARVAERNAALEEEAATDAIKRGDKEAGLARTRGRQVVGAQRAALAAQGIDVGSGSALDLQKDTAALSAEDAETIKTNAWREAWGHKIQAQNYREGAKFSRQAGENAQRNSILAGGLRGAGSLVEGGRQFGKDMGWGGKKKEQG